MESNRKIKGDKKWEDKIKEKIKEYKMRKENCTDIETEIRLDVKIRAYEELLKGSE